MIGSPDLLAFTTETEFLEQSTDSLELPADLSVPPHPRPQYASPWSRGVCFDKDFIFISEFSEQVGPQPVLTIPEDPKTRGTFDLNHFSLRIMSVDYQSTLTGSASYTHAKLNFVEDSKVVLGGAGEGAYAYVHHLTLYDLEARGFVRPFCLVYVSSEEEKIMRYFRQLSAEFTKASECLKTGNRKNFAIEVDKKLSDLEYTRSVLLREINRERLRQVKSGQRNGTETKGNRNRDLLLATKKEEVKEKQRCGVSFKEADRNDSMPGFNKQGNEPDFVPIGINHHNEQNRSGNAQSPSGQSIMWACKADELTRVENVIQEHRSLLKQISSYPNRKLRDPQFLPYEPDDVYHSLESDLDPSTLYSQSPGSVGECSDCLHTPTLVSLSKCQQFDKRLKNLDELCDKYFLQQALNQLRSIERRFRCDSSYLLSRQQTQNLLSHLKSTNFLFEDLHDLEKETGQQLSRPQPALPLPLSPIQSGPVSLDSYTSCVEMVPIRLGLHRNGPESVPTSPCDELPMPPNFLAGDNRRTEEVSLPMKDSISSGESIEVLGTEKSVRTHTPSDVMETVPQRHEAFPGTAFEGQKRKEVTRRENSEDSIEVLSVTDSIIPDDLRASCPSAIFEEPPENEEDEENNHPMRRPEDILVQCEEKEQEYQHSATSPTIVINPPDHRISLDLCTASACSPVSEPGFLQDRPFRFTPDDFSDCTSYLSLGSTGSTLSVDFHGENSAAGSRRKRSRLGRAALNFLRQFPFAVHAMYSLLIGRTVVVLGRKERAVRRLVTALTVYTPHLQWCRGNVQPWTSNPLQITDLLTWKLIGYNRSSLPSSQSVPPCLLRFSRYLSLLDMDQKTLHCPVYKGSLIGPLMEARTCPMRGTTYFLYAQSIISQLVSRAFLLTFSHKLWHPSDTEAEVRYRHVFGEFHDDDLKILQYLSELITQHMTGTSDTVLRFSYTASSVFKI